MEDTPRYENPSPKSILSRRTFSSSSIEKREPKRVSFDDTLNVQVVERWENNYDAMSRTSEENVHEIERERVSQPDGQPWEIERNNMLADMRYYWTNLLNCIRYSFSLGNIWRFPYIAYNNGGGSFLFVYIIITIILRIPVYYMELAITQFSGLRVYRAWTFCSLFKGIGLCIAICAFIIALYYNVIVTYALLYLLESLRSILIHRNHFNIPWKNCHKWWGADENCYNTSLEVPCSHMNTSTGNELYCISSVEQYWIQYVLSNNAEIGNLKFIKYYLGIILFVLLILTASITGTRLKTLSCVAHFKIFFSFFALLPPLFYLLYKGELDGLAKLFSFSLEQFFNLHVWSEATQQSFYSLGLGMGSLTVIRENNSYHHNITRVRINIYCAL